MARMNNRPSVVSSRYASATPMSGDSSDQENRDPSINRRDKGKGRAVDSSEHQRSSLPTPNSDDSAASRGQKRKRHETIPGEQGEEDEDFANEEARFNRYFDPNQDQDERREVKRKSRALERDFAENRDALMRDSGEGLTNTIHQANEIYQHVKQTNDATLDSRLLVNVSDLANKKTAQLVLGDSSSGIDVDEFLSKCITFMQNGGPLERNEDDVAPSTGRRRRTRPRENSDDEEEDDIETETLDWEVFGRDACFPNNHRPCVPSFLLGPLSVEKKQRTQTQRRARQTKDTSGREARPENLTRAHLSQSDENSLTAICTRIRKHLVKHLEDAEAKLRDDGFTSFEALQSGRGQRLLRELRVSDHGGVSLFDYILNPRSFGQTVENLFYISFLIKEGSIGIDHDGNGLPLLMPATARTLEEQRQMGAKKHQAVMAIDYGMWQRLVEAYEVERPLIPHRAEESQAAVGSRGWYA